MNYESLHLQLGLNLFTGASSFCPCGGFVTPVSELQEFVHFGTKHVKAEWSGVEVSGKQQRLWERSTRLSKERTHGPC